MGWIELTDLSGSKLYVNLSQVVSIKQYGDTSYLSTTKNDKAGTPVVIQVLTPAAEIYALARSLNHKV